MRAASQKSSHQLPRAGHARKIAVIGSINRDEVWDAHGNRRRGWGGILYNIAALARHAPERTTILPIAHMGSDARVPVGRWLRSLPQVDISSLLPLAKPGNLCQMRYINPDQRHERLLNRVPAIPREAIRHALSADVALVNFISGADVTTGTLEFFRREFRGWIYLDIHSYLLGRRKDSSRFARRPSGWRRVVSCADVLQMNQVEFTTLSGEYADSRSVLEWVDNALTPLAGQCVLVTLGAAGAFCMTRTRSRWRLRHFRSGKRPAGADPTGCGDTFCGLWLSAWLKGLDYVKCTEIATLAAAHPIRPGV